MITEIDPLPDAFGGWQFIPITDTSGVSFSLDTTPDEHIPVWRQELPLDPEAAAAELLENEAQMQLSMQALDEVPGRIDALVLQTQQANLDGISFAADSLAALPEPEADLMDLVQTINKPAVGVSFAVGGEDQNKLKAAFAQFSADMEHILRLVTHFAWVETQVEDALIGRSIVSWTGDLDTTWKSGLKDEIHQLHKSSLNQALATRNLVLHAVTITAKSAAKLAVLLATPGGAILALPVAWKFIKQILADVQKYKQLTKIPI